MSRQCLFILFIIVCSPISYGLQDKFQKPSHNYEDMLEVMKRTTEKLFERHHCAIVNILTAVADEKHENYSRLKTDILSHFYAVGKRDVRLSNKHANLSTIHKKLCNIFMIDSISSFEVIFTQITSQKFKFFGIYLMLILDIKAVDLEQLFAMMWKKSIFNVYVIHEETNAVTLSTFFPFKSISECGNTSPVILNQFINKKFTKDLVIPAKLDNLHGCPIRVTGFQQSTAVMKKIHPNGTVNYHGHEVSLMKTLAEKLNFTVVMRFRDGFEQWGNIYENGTSTATLAELMNGQADIAIGDYFLKPTRIKFVDSSESYLNYPVLLVVPRGEKLTSMEKLVRPFEQVVWILLLIAFAVGLLVIFVVNFMPKQIQSFIYGKNVKQPVMNMLVVIIGSQQRVLPMGNFARFILMMFIILCLVLRSIYQGSLYQFLQSDGRHKEVQSIQDMIERGYTVLTYDSYHDIISENPELAKISRNIHRTSTNNNVPEEKTALLSTITVLIGQSQDLKSFPYKICKEHLVTVNIVFYCTKGFFLRKKLDIYIGSLVSSGLIEHWISKYDNTRFWNYPTKIGPRVLRIDHLIGSFYILAFGYLCAAIVLLIEIFIDRCLIVKKPLNLIH
jgi:ABC-type amino acid transport substrate-binding protein